MGKKSLFESAFRSHIKHEKRLLTEADDVLADALDGDIEGEGDGMGFDDLESDERSLEDAMNIDQDYENMRSQVQNQKIQKALDKQRENADQLISEWVTKIDEFVRFINDPEEPNSIRSILKNVVPGTTLDKISGPDTRRMNKVATEAAALSQALRSYIGGVKEGAV